MTFTKIQTALKSVVHPRAATEEKAAQKQPSQAQADEQDARQRVRKLSAGEQLDVQDPTTGGSVRIGDITDEPDTANKGTNVLQMPFPEPGTLDSLPFVVLEVNHFEQIGHSIRKPLCT
jgi:pyruvate/2-oxoglutarate dehydrogenase complex dihydrolipoamide acyltransferase (E2) component